MARTATPPADERIPYEFHFKGKAITWMENVAARHGITTDELARELFALGSQHWQRAHPDDVNPAALKA